MATTHLTETDMQVRDAVMRQLESDPAVDTAGVGVTAKNGVVALTGFIDSYTGKLAAERAAKRVRGVRAVANDIDVRLRMERSDPEIATDAASALALRSALPDNLQAVVHNGHVTLTGKVTWMFQKISAEDAVRHVRSVRGVRNYIEIVPKAFEHDVLHRIVAALHRQADLDATHISVNVTGDVAVLTGHVETWLQRKAAERASGNAPGIARVDNRLVVDPPQALDADTVDEMC
jgi:osmotically-inducible protein OsmY